MIGVSRHPLLGRRQLLGKPGVRVSVVRFGFVDTKMAKASVRPMMISPDRAAEVILGVIKHGPAIKTYPLAVEALVSIVTALTSWRMRRDKSCGTGEVDFSFAWPCSSRTALSSDP